MANNWKRTPSQDDAPREAPVTPSPSIQRTLRTRAQQLTNFAGTTMKSSGFEEIHQRSIDAAMAVVEARNLAGREQAQHANDPSERAALSSNTHHEQPWSAPSSSFPPYSLFSSPEHGVSRKDHSHRQRGASFAQQPGGAYSQGPSSSPGNVTDCFPSPTPKRGFAAPVSETAHSSSGFQPQGPREQLGSPFLGGNTGGRAARLTYSGGATPRGNFGLGDQSLSSRRTSDGSRRYNRSPWPSINRPGPFGVARQLITTPRLPTNISRGLEGGMNMPPATASSNLSRGYQGGMNMPPSMCGSVRPRTLFAGAPTPPASRRPNTASHRVLGPTQGPPAQVQPCLPPLNLEQRHFNDSGEARQYLIQPYWRPITQSYGVPQTEAERLPYVKKIHDALVDTSKVYDRMTWASDMQRFHPTHGVWATEPRCIEAIAHQVVEECVAIHNRGVTGLTLGRLPSLQQPDHSDRIFTFPERIHLFAMLVRHWKFAANQVMESSLTTQYLARIWTTLWDQPEFQFKWRSSSSGAQRRVFDVDPYEGMPAQPITEELRARYMLEAEGSEFQRQQRTVRHQRHLEDMRMQPSDVMKRPPAHLRSPATQAASQAAHKRPRLEGPSAVEQQPRAAGQESSGQASEFLPAGHLDVLDFPDIFNVDQPTQDGDAQRQRELDRLFQSSPVQLADDGASLGIDGAQYQGEQKDKPAGDQRDD
ncbi:hypothetical protein BDU57DRAFT_529566 [Ampelomyces quisqualis]|uniref:Uncharacterized protein n=1 Tax=Ampelomyces quisqualis TaxID=50730 RepID=A0A6A5QM54_AMPQU|nr:hypothetical protein BDU57DRAFT_529566 [Ampelomyces quisqualis]